MDSINVVTALVGLLGSAGKVVGLLLVVKKSISEAPRLMDQMLAQVQELEISFSALQSFLLGIGSAPRGRTSMIRVEQLVAILTEAVLTFSELEALVTAIVKDKGRLPVIARLKSLWKEERVSSIMLRLERHKSSLSLMMNIAQCESDFEAEQSREALQSLVEHLLRSNYEISMRLRSIEESLETRSVITCCFRNGTMPEVLEDGSQVKHVTQLEEDPAVARPEEFSLGIKNSISHPTGFQVDLGTSRVYQRTKLYQSDASFTTSGIRTHAWSIFSNLSLSDISVISTIALPLYWDDIHDQEWYTPRKSDHCVLGETKQWMSISAPTVAIEESSSTAAANVDLIDPQSSFEPESKEIFHQNVPPWPPTFLKPPPMPSFRRETTPSIRSGYMALHRIAVLGDGGVGRIELINDFALQLSVTPDDGTLIDSFRACTAIDGQGCMLDVRSTSGLEEYTAIWDQCMHDSEGFLLVYSVTSRASFTRIPRFHNQIRRVTGLISDENLPPKADGNELPPLNCPVILVGANIDREREVSTKEGHELAIKLRCDFVEVSVKNCINIGKPFCEIVRLLRRRHIMNTAVRIRRPSMTYKNQRGAISVSNIVRRRVWR